MRIAQVEWLDAWIGTDDIKIKKARKLKCVRRFTVGYLLSHDEDRIVMSTDYFPAKEVKEASAPMVIPMGMVVEWFEFDVD